MMSELSVTVLDGKTSVEGGFKGEPYLKSEKDGLIASSSHYSPFMFDYEFVEGDEVVFKSSAVDSVSYVLRNKSRSLKDEIGSDVYSQLTRELKALYVKSVSRVESLVPWEGTTKVFDLNLYASQNSELVVYGEDDVVKALESLNFKLGVKDVMIEGVHSSRRDVPSSLRVVFFAADYDGSMRKLLQKKSNGQPYADRRGRTVPDYPAVVEKVEVPASLIPTLVAGSEGEMRSKVAEYFMFLAGVSSVSVPEEG